MLRQFLILLSGKELSTINYQKNQVVQVIFFFMGALQRIILRCFFEKMSKALGLTKKTPIDKIQIMS